MLSKFVYYSKIDNNYYAIYNSLIMDVLYVSEMELNHILNNKVKEYDLIQILFKSGIYINSSNKDFDALNLLKNFNEEKKGVIDIMYLILTNNCNLKCKYCFLENNPNNSHHCERMVFSTAKNAIDKFFEYLQNTNQNKASIIFYGGEPLLEKELFKNSILYCLNLPIDWNLSIITNGTLLDKDTIEFCKKNNITIGLSIDGPQNIHDKNRLFKTSNLPTYDLCLKSKKMLDEKNINYGLSMVVSEDFLSEKESVLKWIFNNHKGDIFYNLLHYSDIDTFNNDYAYKAVQYLIDSFERSEKNNFQIKEGRIQRQIDSISKQKFVFSDCGAVGCHQFTVLPSGMVTICHGDSVNKKHWIKSIQEIDLLNLSNTDEGNFWSNISTLEDDECLACPAIFICGGGCPHQSENVNNLRGKKEGNYCIYVKEVLKWLLKRGLTQTLSKSNTEEEIV